MGNAGKVARLLGGIALLAISPGAKAAWLEARTNNFVVLADVKDAEIRSLASRLERYDQGLRRMRGMPPVTGPRSNPVTVYVVPGITDVQRLCNGGRKKPGCNNIAGWYMGRAEGSVAFTPRRSGQGSVLDLNAQTVLFHEYAHHFMLENWAAAYPAWFIEGFAEFNGTATFEKDGALGFGQPAYHRFYGLVSGKPLPLATMLAADRPLRTAQQREALYGRGWLLTHYLTLSGARKGQLDAYLTAINQGMRGQKAAETAFGDIATLDHELDTYLNRRSLSYIRIDPAALTPVTMVVRPLSAGEGAMMPVRMRSDRGVDNEEARLLLAEARRVAAAFPADAGVQAALAEAEYDAGNDDLAEAAADRALAADARMREAMVYKGRAQVRRLERTGIRDPKAWIAARRWYLKANSLDHDDAAALMLFYTSFLAEGRPPTANAVAALQQAFMLVPQDESLRWMLVRRYAEEGRLKEARETLAPLAYDPHAAADNPFATVLAAIDTRDVAAVRAAIRAVENQPPESETSGAPPARPN
ncbi:tetratricopeptide repeat protein [Sphingomonas solaris]|uniref:Tetratricopeptide repeat protein n=1 Tax=Alterirhizorhabdus solaris TaxID=2529389 RepID=A0A558R6J1_9SPHN|nr:tetratricopeptide repeat protein [Sphingomonas solaris]TVV75000.1 tetratricopeptide repeat protein [Sphingomonas solaris]